MAPQTFWKGYLKLSLVTCGVKMAPATTQSEKVRFHTLNRKTNNRVASRYVDAETGEVVADEDEVKGFKHGGGKYVMMEDDELDAVDLESTHTIDVEVFVPRQDIEWIWLDTPHYLLPNDKVAQEAFSVIRDAMAATKTVGISRLVIYRRERAVMLEPRDRGIVLWTLRYGNEVRPETNYFSDISKAKPDPGHLKIAEDLIERQMRRWDPSIVTDPIQEKLLELIKEKQKSRKKRTKPKSEARPSGNNVINIMDALRQSVEADHRRKSGR